MIPCKLARPTLPPPPPPPHHTNVCKISWLCGVISSLLFKKSLSNLASSLVLRRSFLQRQRIFAKWSPSILEKVWVYFHSSFFMYFFTILPGFGWSSSQSRISYSSGAMLPTVSASGYGQQVSYTDLLRWISPNDCALLTLRDSCFVSIKF